MARPEHNSSTGWVFDEEFLRHNADLDHPECADRLRAILRRLTDDGLLDRVETLSYPAATEEEITQVHTREYIGRLAQAEGQYWDPDTFVGPGSPGIARLAAGGVMAATRAVWRGELANAFCAVRPPGHHALADRAMGFCLLNNVAVAAADILAREPGAKVLILDWDVHHGNGTQAIFYESAQVMYASMHQYPFYPGSGAASETGRGKGEGFTVNRPLAAGSGEEEFLAALADILDGPAHRFDPDLLLVSAGFDAHADDPLANLRVTTGGFVLATRRVCAFAREHCGGKVVSVLEGGYDLDSLADSAAAHLRVLIETAREQSAGAES